MKNGFTFIELLFSLVILSIMSLGVYQVLSIGNMTFHTDSALSDLQQETRRVSERMWRELRETDPLSSLSIPEGTSSSNISFNTALGSSITYAFSGNQVTRNGSVIANNITALTFTRGSGADGNLLTIQITARKSVRNVHEQDVSFPLTVNVRIRND